jgi:hypothetical protein
MGNAQVESDFFQPVPHPQPSSSFVIARAFWRLNLRLEELMHRGPVEDGRVPVRASVHKIIPVVAQQDDWQRANS